MTAERELVQAVTEVLDQGEELLAWVDDAAWIRTVPAVFDGSIGAHYRHCLDHLRSLLDAAGGAGLNYDVRERGTPVERDRAAALAATRTLREAWARLHPACLRRQLAVTCKTSFASRGSQRAASTVGREVMYVVAHAVHHYALIAVLAGMLGVQLPEGFGVAPSTAQYQHDRRRAGA